MHVCVCVSACVLTDLCYLNVCAVRAADIFASKFITPAFAVGSKRNKAAVIMSDRAG